MADERANDIWFTISEFPNYEITANGDVRHKGHSNLRKRSVGKRGYNVISFKKDGKSYVRTLHILLARTFLPNPDNLPQVNHIDGNKLNNSLDNLEWCSARDNTLHARRTGLQKSDGDKSVSCYDGSKLVATYKSISEASRQTGISRSSIGFVARGKKKYKTAGGYKWKYA